jgi:hypothetical protein
MTKNKVNLIDDDLWDHYSGLPNPLWYQHITEIKDEEEDTNDSTDTKVTTR